MEVMYLKYTNGIRHSIIKEGGDTIIVDSKIIPFNYEKNLRTDNSIAPFISKESDIPSMCNYKINEEITNFFFGAIHKNYLSTRKKHKDLLLKS